MLIVLHIPMDRFIEFLEKNRRKNITTVTPGGNHGDTLIHMGLIKKLRELDIKYNSINLEKEYNAHPIIGLKFLINIALWKLGTSRGFRLIEIPENTDLILFEGGGYMSDIWYGPALIQQISKRNPQPIAIAPQSYLFDKTDPNDFFKDGRDVKLFCREKFSLKHLEEQKLSSNIEIELSQDTALYLEKKDLDKYIKPCDEYYELIAFRKDRESILTNNTKKKVLRECINPLEKDISMTKQLEDFVSWVANAGKVYTDRLHVAILAKIMDKKTRLYPNKYYKNIGVWEYSLKESISFINENISEF